MYPALLETTAIKSNNTGQVHHIKTAATSKTANVVYIIQCKRCGIQYVGETGQEIHKRINSHRSDIRLRKTAKKPVVPHFNATNHTITDMQVFVVDKTPTNDNALRKSWKSRWIRTLKTESPDGLNLKVDRL